MYLHRECQASVLAPGFLLQFLTVAAQACSILCHLEPSRTFPDGAHGNRLPAASHVIPELFILRCGCSAALARASTMPQLSTAASPTPASCYLLAGAITSRYLFVAPPRNVQPPAEANDVAPVISWPFPLEYRCSNFRLSPTLSGPPSRFGLSSPNGPQNKWPRRAGAVIGINLNSLRPRLRPRACCCSVPSSS